jgi:hypothetical protein
MLNALKNLFAGYRSYAIGLILIAYGVYQIINKQADACVNHIIAGAGMFTLRAAIK